MRSQFLVFMSLVLLSLCSTAMGSDVTQQPKLADYTDGEKWVWKYKGVTSSGEIRADGIDTKKIISKNGELFMVTAPRTFPLTDIVKPVDSKKARYNWPLQVGKKWTLEEHWESEDGTKGSTIQDAKVLSFKAETVEAGTFMAYTIQYKGKITNTRGYSANTEDIHVYAPELKMFIKLTQIQDDYVYVEELIEYSK
ncbi:hypothetical protein WG68_05360 [Arsukibacterium ikkense]|uniref:Uncharacterized protein n=1 Tax=Arsukibacterium ikkense TaxID=336831 RepID=A0A0M2V8G3_9GAMM|nr:hypothetical protein [Arsukibacterium ikkense]KKO46709.1 hypothetical protein WG68_05360 [Arsukibacterium ikkense]